ncbi:hypothetical protein PM082_000427 [Marasmius tenuissimus]|nr:hypothetical protein PM082_000427 [Marasmius tenuissimus]
MTSFIEGGDQGTVLDQPRVQLLGLPESEWAQYQKLMPALHDVRNDAKLADEFLKEPVTPSLHAIGNMTGDRFGDMHPAVAYHHIFPKLYMFSLLCHEDDVPEDLRHICLWALRQRLIAISEATERELSTIIPHDGDRHIDESAKILMDARTRVKITSHCLQVAFLLTFEILGFIPTFSRKPEVNLLEEALSHLESQMTLEEKRGLASSCLGHTESDALYGSVLARTGSRDADAKRVLERVIKELEGNTDEKRVYLLVQSKLYLARVLRRKGEVSDAEPHEAFLIRWFKRHSLQLPESLLRQWFTTEHDDDPVFKALGGAKWMKNRKKITSKTFLRETRACYSCGLREDLLESKKLMKCSKCQSTVYCSKECQRRHYPFHKIICRDPKARQTEDCDPNANSSNDARCIEDWNRFKNSGFDGNTASFHALGMHRDLNRGKTHILVKKIRYVPDNGSDLFDRFRIDEAGVFKISEAMNDLDHFMGGPGGVKRGMEMLRRDFRSGPGKDESTTAEFFNLYISDDPRIRSYLRIAGVRSDAKDFLEHDPFWRRSLNRGKKRPDVKPLVTPSRIRDVEYDYLDPQGSSTTPSHAPVSGAPDSSHLSLGRNIETTRDSAVVGGSLPGLRGVFKKR